MTRRTSLLLSLFTTVLLAQEPWALTLPPELPWSGKSETLILSSEHPWVTPAEKSNLTDSPDYATTVAWLKKLVAASPQLKMVSIGTSAEGRHIWMVIASAEQAFTHSSLKTMGKPTVLIQAGIHSGEIDGKDAGMMLLRDMTVVGTKSDILHNANLLFIPIFSVDGHERSSTHNRINQRGPTTMGWRTNSRNLNLNRDYAKMDTREMQALINVLNLWDPDLYIDVHVTDGIDYQYDITYGFEGEHGYSPSISRWLSRRFKPAIDDELTNMGHIPGPLIFAVDNNNPGRGIVKWAASQRYSNGYGDARHLPTILVENHSLKPYRQRVLGTYVFMETALRSAGRDSGSLIRAIQNDRTRQSKKVTLTWKAPESKPDDIAFQAVAWQHELSPITGDSVIVFTGDKIQILVPYPELNVPKKSVRRPKAYWIHPAWNTVIDRLNKHGIYMDRMTTPRTVSVEQYRLTNVQLRKNAFEGHIMVTAMATPERARVTYPAGSVRVPTDQPLGDLAVLLLEPDAPDSFFQWGFFLEVLQRTEYAEAYAMEPMARKMLEIDPDMKAAFEARLTNDEQFAQSPRARLQWFYEQSPYYDEKWMVYPVGRE